MFFLCYFIYCRVKNLFKREKETLITFFILSLILSIFLIFGKNYFNQERLVEIFSTVFENVHFSTNKNKFLFLNFSALYFLSFKFFLWFFFFNDKKLNQIIKDKTQNTLSNNRANILLVLNVTMFILLIFWYFFSIIFFDIRQFYKFLFILFLIILYFLVIFLLHYNTSFKYYRFLWNKNTIKENLLRVLRQIILGFFCISILYLYNYFYSILFKFLFPKPLLTFWQLNFDNFNVLFGNKGIIVIVVFYFFLFFLLSLLYFFYNMYVINIISLFIITLLFDDIFYRRYDKDWFNLHTISNTNIKKKNISFKKVKILKQPLFKKNFYFYFYIFLFLIILIFIFSLH